MPVARPPTKFPRVPKNTPDAEHIAPRPPDVALGADFWASLPRKGRTVFSVGLFTMGWACFKHFWPSAGPSAARCRDLARFDILDIVMSVQIVNGITV